MKILRSIGILVIVTALLIGGTGNVLAKGGPPDPLPGNVNHSSGKQGLFGTVSSVVTEEAGVEYTISLETKQETVDVTINSDTKYQIPRQTHGPKANLSTFVDMVDENEDDNLDELVGERVAVLVNSDFEALKLMLIPSGPPSHAHRVGIVVAFAPYVSDGEGTNGSIEIIDKDGVSHTFTITEDTVYRPSSEEEQDLIDALMDGCVTVVTTGDPKQLHPEPDPPPPDAKAVVLHENMPDWAGGKIIVYKIVNPDTSEQSFEFIADYYLDSFNLSHGEHDNSGWLEPGEYDITENMEELPEGWALIIEIDDPDNESSQDGTTATVDLDRGEVVTVTFTNTFTEPIE